MSTQHLPESSVFPPSVPLRPFYLNEAPVIYDDFADESIRLDCVTLGCPTEPCELLDTSV